METASEKPTCVSMIVCDSIYRDEQTKNLIIVGTFNCILAREFPATHPKMSVLFTLTNGKGKVHLSLSIEHASSGVKVLEMNGPLEMNDPLAIQDFHVPFANLPLPAEGKYWVVLKVDGEIINERPFFATKVKSEPKQESGDE